jgi:hypothetical protein
MQTNPITLNADSALAPPVKAAIEVALAVGVKNVPFNVPRLHGIVTVAVAFSVADDMVNA